MPVELRRGGLHLSGTPLWLDATRKTELSFVSHAHSDHVARHERVIATPATLKLMEHRLGAVPGPLPVPYRRPISVGALSVELFPAGHILGSAQVRVTRPDGLRVVYTGDLNSQPSLTAEPLEVVEADVLVLESTFGHPRYVFPPREEVLRALFAWVEEQLSAGVAPLVLGYPLGKAQEAIAALTARGFPVCAHPKVYAIALLYQELGVRLSPPGALREFDGTWKKGEVGVFPPYLRSQAARRVWPRAAAVLTGWAADGAVARRYGADVAFCVSDHADHPALVELAKATRAREVVTHHGFARELAFALREHGLQARAATQLLQLELFGGVGQPPGERGASPLTATER